MRRAREHCDDRRESDRKRDDRRGRRVGDSRSSLAATASNSASAPASLRAAARSPSARPLSRLRPDATVAAVIPVLDEAATIVGVLAELREAGSHASIVVDGGSRDGTAELAHRAGAVVIREPRRGYGRACLAGAAAAASDIVVFLDGDGSDDPAFIPNLLGCILEGGAVLALAARSRREPGALLAHQMLGNRLVSLLVRLLHGVRVDDVPPMRAIRLRCPGAARPA